MVGYVHGEYHLPSWQYSLAGAISGVGGRIVSQPFDVIKIRFQLQIDPVHRAGRGKYHNVMQAARIIYREEGINAFWKGHIPAQLLSIVFQTAQFAAYEVYTKAADRVLGRPESLPFFATFVCGGLCGCTASLCAHPFDVIRTRLVAQGEPKFYAHMLDAARKMYRTEGLLSLYKGVIPTLAQMAPQAGIQFTAYTLFVRLLRTIFGLRERDELSGKKMRPGAPVSLAAGVGAGVTAKFFVFPFDLLKKRMQVTGFEHARTKFGTVHKYDGLMHMIGVIWKHERFRGFYKGLFPSLLKSGVATGSSFLFYEQSCRYFAIMRRNSSAATGKAHQKYFE